MYILGLHTGHDASACLFKGNELVAFCKEERLNRIKNDGGYFSLQSVEEVLRIANVSRDELDAVALTRLYLPISVYRRSQLSFKNLKRQVFKQRRDLNLYRYMNSKKSIEFEKIINVDKLKEPLKISAYY